jgi:hypothetical protein
MKQLIRGLFIFLLPLFAGMQLAGSCDTGPAEVPAYIRIDTIPLDSTYYDSTGSVIHRINTAWVYVSDNLQGVYNLPALFPVLAEEDVKVEIFAGVNENGISSRRIRYPFYESWTKVVKLNRGDTSLLQPSVRYRRGFQLPFLEDFEGAGTKVEFAQGSGFFTHDQSGSFAEEGIGCGILYLPPGGSDLIVQTLPIEIPSNLAGYFAEISYRNNSEFVIGIRAANAPESQFLVGVRPRENWNKLYINITDAVDRLSAMTSNYRLFVRVLQDSTINDQLVYIDNLKILF